MGTAIKLHAPPTQPVQLLLANAAFFSGKVKCMHAWILHEENERNIFFMNINEQTVSCNLNRYPSTAYTHDIMDNSKGPDCPSIHFNT